MPASCQPIVPKRAHYSTSPRRSQRSALTRPGALSYPLGMTWAKLTERATVVALVGGLVAYAVIALAQHRFLSGVAAPVVAALLVWRHPRARFSAYLFFSAVFLRGVVSGAWPMALFAAAGILVLQLAPARRAWPRLVPGATRSASTRADDCSRMAPP